ELKTAFCNKAKYIAYKIDHSNYSEIESELIKNINQFDFYEAESIEKVFPEVNPIFKTEINIYPKKEENKVYYKGYWKTNSELIAFLFGLIDQENIERVWFENVFIRWDDD